MADYEYRNKAFDYTPPNRSGSGAGGALLFIGGIFALFILAMVFMGGGDGGVTAPEAAGGATAPAVETAPPAVPAVPTE
ncbi:hypothetical protein V8J82_16740 [Gymnodinialimonas sp. 2305UL16-5]|uniref:hypothetical protein n=1 Tax=Gymnodinialimonas mytili TaxID=3126503 RepID=UPI00309BFF74